MFSSFSSADEETDLSIVSTSSITSESDFDATLETLESISTFCAPLFPSSKTRIENSLVSTLLCFVSSISFREVSITSTFSSPSWMATAVASNSSVSTTSFMVTPTFSFSLQIAPIEEINSVAPDFALFDNSALNSILLWLTTGVLLLILTFLELAGIAPWSAWPLIPSFKDESLSAEIAVFCRETRVSVVSTLEPLSNVSSTVAASWEEMELPSWLTGSSTL